MQRGSSASRNANKQPRNADNIVKQTYSDSDDDMPNELQLLQASVARQTEIDAEIAKFAATRRYVDNMGIDEYLQKQEQLEPERKRIDKLSLEQFVDYKIVQENRMQIKEYNEKNRAMREEQALAKGAMEAIYSRKVAQAEQAKKLKDVKKPKEESVQAKIHASDNQSQKVSFPVSNIMITIIKY